MSIKYPEQIFSVARTDKRLGIDAKLFVPDTAKGQPPLELHAGFSRMVFTILSQQSGNYKFVSANLPVHEIDLIEKETDIAVEMLANKSLEKSSSSSSKAYNVTFFLGEFKGKTPADVLAQDASKEGALLNYKKQLEANLSKYPRNKDQIEAIDEAIALSRKGELSLDGVKSNLLDIYRADVRAPHATKTDAEGFTDVYSFSVVCDASKNYPFTITIMNGKATCAKHANGIISPNLQTLKDKKEFSMMLTKAEWYKAVKKMKKVVTYFEEMNFEKLLKISQSEAYNNYNANNSDKK